MIFGFLTKHWKNAKHQNLVLQGEKNKRFITLKITLKKKKIIESSVAIKL